MDKKNFVKFMNELILATTDEDVIESWIQVVPDQADEDDFKDIAEDEELFLMTMNKFLNLSKHLKEGVKLFGNWYFGNNK
jgi:hypothetical protein